MKTIVFKNKDGSLIFVKANEKKYSEDNSHECKAAKKLIEEGISYFKIEDSDMPIFNIDFKHPVQLYHDGSDEIKIDTNWDRVIMPPVIIREKELAKEKNNLDVLLESKDSSSIEVIDSKLKYLVLLENKPNKDSLFWHEKALEGLDAKVNLGENDKPVIRAKLNAKIIELKK